MQFRNVVSDVRANGVLGFLYRRFGSRNMGQAFLSSQTEYSRARSAHPCSGRALLPRAVPPDQGPRIHIYR